MSVSTQTQARADTATTAAVPLAARIALGALLLVVAFGAMHLFAPVAETPLAFRYLPKPFGQSSAVSRQPSAVSSQPSAPSSQPSGLEEANEADAAAARAVAEAFLAAVQAEDFAAAWARLDPLAREATTEAAWTAEQRLWSAATGPAPELRLTRMEAYPVSPNRVLAFVESPAIRASETAAGAPFPELALELVRRDGQWWVANPASLWAGGSPAQLRPADRAGLGWLRYPLRTAPLPDDLALMARVAALTPPPGARLADVTPDERALVNSNVPGYDPAQLVPGVRATWTLAGGEGREAATASWAGALREGGWAVLTSTLRLRLASNAGLGDLELRPLDPRGDTPATSAVLHVTEAPAADAAGQGFRRMAARLGARADALIAGLPHPPGTRLLPSPAEPSSTVATGSGDIASAAYTYYFDRGGLDPALIRTFYASTLQTAGWQRDMTSGEPGFRAPDGAGRLYVTGFEETPLRALTGYTLSPDRYVIVFITTATPG